MGEHEPPATSPYDSIQIGRARDLLEKMPEQIGRYRILEPIGGGGMGEVYRAEQRSPVRREVAIKVIKLGMDTKLVIARFEAERQALAMMDHPHIAKVYDADTDDRGRPYFVMEYVKGRPITDYADANHLTIDERLRLFEQVCHAIQHAHHKGIIHRDLKPGNVLVSTQDGKPHARVIDFGIAKAISAQLTDKTLFTRHDQFVGTPQYMSPEQADGSLDVDTRTDVYSLGVMLYELLTGSTPFTSDEMRVVALEQVKKVICEVDPPKPSTRLSRSTQTLPSLAASRRVDPKKLSALVCGELDWIVMKSLEKDRARRYDTPTSLVQDVQRYLEGTPVLAAPPSWSYKASKFVARYKVPIAAVATLFLALTAGIIGTSYGMRKAILAKQSDDARHELEQRSTAEAAAAKDAKDLEEYIADLAHVQAAIQAQNWPEARRRLEACPVSKRGWEWQFLSNEALPFTDRLGIPRFDTVSMSPNGKTLLVVPEGSENKLAYLWDVEKSQLLNPPLTHVTFPTAPVLWSLAGDRVLTHDNQEKAHTSKLWDTGTGKLVASVTHNHEHDVTLSPDGRRAWRQCTGNADLWDMTAIEKQLGPTHYFENKEPNVFNKRLADFSADSSTLFVGVPKAILLISAETGDQLSRIEVEKDTWRAELTKDGSRIMIAGDNSARVCDTRTGQTIDSLTFADELRYIYFRSDGTHLLCASTTTFWIWEIGSEPKVVQSIDLTELFPMTDSTRFDTSPDGSRLIVRNETEAVLIDTGTKKVLGPRLKFKEHVPHFDRSGEHVLAIDGTGAFLYWNLLGSLEAVLRPAPGRDSGEPFLIDAEPHWIFPDQRVLIGARGSVIGANLQGPDSPREVVDDRLGPALYTARSAAQSPSTRTPVASTQPNREVRVDSGNGNVRVINGAPAPTTAWAITPDGSRIALASVDSVHFWDLGTLRELTSFKTLVSDVSKLAFSEDGGQLAIYGAVRQIELWDVRPHTSRQGDRVRRHTMTNAARERVGELLGNETPFETVQATIEAGADVTPLQKAIELEELEHRRETIRAKAKYRIAQLWNGNGFFSDVIDHPARITDVRLRAELTRQISELTFEHSDALWEWIASNHLPKREYQFYAERLQGGYSDEPNSHHHLNSIAYAAYRTGDYRRCVETLGRREAIDPANAGLAAGTRRHMADWAFLAMSHFRLGQFDQAQSNLATFRENYASGDAEHKTRYRLLAIEAISMIEPNTLEAYATDPANLNQFADQVTDCADATRADVESALRAAKLACRLAPNNPLYTNTLAKAHHRLGEFGKALETFQMVEWFCVDSESALPANSHWPIRSMAAFRAGKHADAEAYFKKMLAIPNPPVMGIAAALREEATAMVDPDRELVADPPKPLEPTTRPATRSSVP